MKIWRVSNHYNICMSELEEILNTLQKRECYIKEILLIPKPMGKNNEYPEVLRNTYQIIYTEEDAIGATV